MTVKELIEKLQALNPNDKLMLIQEEELECVPEMWDDEKGEVSGVAVKLYSEDLHSHEMYLLAIRNG